MATVIDSLFIELGLDTSKFDTAQKKSIEQLRKFDEISTKTSKNTQLETKRTTEGFNKATDSLIAFGTAFVGIQGFTSFASALTTTNAALGRNANLFSMSGRELDAWGGVLKSVGGDASTFQASIQAMQSGVAGIKLGDAAILTPLARLGALGSIDINKGTIDIYKLSDALKSFREANGEQLTFTLAQQLGMNKETFMVLEQGSGIVRNLYDENYKLSGINKVNTDQAQKLQTEWGLVSQAFTGAENKIMDHLYPSLSSLVTETKNAIITFSQWDEQLGGFLSKTGALSGSLLALASVMKVISLIPGPVGFVAKVASVALAAAGIGTAVVGGAAGLASVQTDKSLPRNLRNNNPGNIEYGEFAKAHGATSSDGRFAIFPDMKTGENAMSALLASYAKKGANTIQSIISKWSPSGDNGAANTNAYIADVAKQTGIDPNKDLSASELTAVQQAMSKHEGSVATKASNKPIPIKNSVKTVEENPWWDRKGFFNSNPMVGANATAPMKDQTSNSNITTNIAAINVHSSNADPKAVVQEMNESAKKNSLLNYGIRNN